jgi:hypothetical protein
VSPKILLLKLLQGTMGIIGLVMLFYGIDGLPRMEEHVAWALISGMQIGLGWLNLKHAIDTQKHIHFEEAVWAAGRCMQFSAKAAAAGDEAKAREWLEKCRKATEYAERLQKEMNDG